MRDYYKDCAYLGMHYMGLAHRYGVNGKIAGNLAALAEIEGCAAVLHGPIGCGYHYRYFMRGRYSPFYDLETSALANRDVIFGGEEKLREALLSVLKKQPEMIAVIPTPVTDVMGEDISGVVRDFMAGRDMGRTKKIIVIKSEAFSHPDKVSARNRLKEKVWNNCQKNAPSTAKFQGCGFIEVLNALVEQVMEEQSVEENTVNIESFAWGYGGTTKLRGVMELLSKIGIKTNTLLPSADYAGIRTAPRASLNIVRRLRWGIKMQDAFGTGYIHFPDLNEWCGVAGIEDFYLRIAERFGLEKTAKAILAREKAKHLPAIEAARIYLSRYRYALATSAPSHLPEYIRLFEGAYRMPLRFVCLMLPAGYQTEGQIDDATMQKMYNNISDAIKEVGSKAVFLLNPTERELAAAFAQTDCLVGDGLLRFPHLETPLLPPVADVRFLDFANYKKALENIAAAVSSRTSGKNLLWHLLDFDKAHYPLPAGGSALAAREMWSRMWKKR